MLQYLYAFLFIVTLFVHLILINDFYKNNKQKEVAKVIFCIALAQVVFGYYLVQWYGVDGALLLKVLGQYSIVIVLFLLRKIFNSKKI